MNHMLKTICQNIENLRFALEFDRFDFSNGQQEKMLSRLEEIRAVVNEVKSKE